jgi:hypothetical protein
MFEDFTVAKEPTTIEKIKKLDDERAKLLESAKADALARAEEAISDLTALGFEFELVEPARGTVRKPSNARKGSAPDHHPKGACPICEFATNPPHDKRSHRGQTKKKPFTDAELAEKGMKMVA